MRPRSQSEDASVTRKMAQATNPVTMIASARSMPITA
jgi:hypothetical protein